MRIFILVIFVWMQTTICPATPINLPKDANGWTIFTPSSDSRIMYVAADGNDTAAASTGVYTSANHPDWSNPFNPTGSVQPFLTYVAASVHAREGYPDWILFKRGETFTLSATFGIAPVSGRSATEPSFIGAYGGAGASPIIKTTETVEQAVRIHSFSPNWIAIAGLDFYSFTRNPLDPGYIPVQTVVNPMGFWVGGTGSSGGAYNGFLIEGCKFRFFFECAVDTTSFVSGLVIRRNVFLDSYRRGNDSHSQGLFMANQHVILEDNIFDHNGWYSQGESGGVGEATMFSHNLYAGNLQDSIIKGNISLRPSSMGFKITGSLGAGSVKNLTLDNNLIYDSEIGIQIEDNYHTANGGINYRVKNSNIINNVIIDMGKSRPTNRTLGLGLQIASWDGGQIDSNYIIHQDSDFVTNSLGMVFYDESKNVSVTNNVIHGFRYARGLVLNDAYGASSSTNMLFSGNKIQIPLNADYTIDAYYNPSGIWTFNNNIYYSDKADGQQFKLVGVNKTFAEWKATTGDTSTFEQASFPDASRDIAGYMDSIGGTATEAEFIAKARAQDRYNWDPNITAEAANAWIKAGFGMGQRRLFRNFRLHPEVEP